MRSAQGTSRLGGTAIARFVAAFAPALCVLAVIAAAPAGGTGGPALAEAAARCAKHENGSKAGTKAGERLIGTGRDDLIRGGGGSDRVLGLGAGDCLRGGPGGDTIKAGSGKDRIAAGPGPDQVNARDGSPDVIRCGGGRDSVKVDAVDVTRGCERVSGRGERPSGDCALDLTTLTAPGCKLIGSDTAANPDATDLWGRIDCASSERYSWSDAGGDPHPTATGSGQPDDAYRRLTAFDGDDVWGERCELGRNDWRNGENRGSKTSGTFALYEEGDHKITFFSQRYPSGSLTDADAWQTVFQNKQTQPYGSDDDSGVALEVQLYDGRLWLATSWDPIWSTPAPASNAWIRYALDVVYSADPSVGSVKAYVDANGDGDWLDSGEQSPLVHTATLATEISGTSELRPGDSIPSHARIGIYHAESIDCPAPSGCAVEVDNVQVVRG